MIRRFAEFKARLKLVINRPKTNNGIDEEFILQPENEGNDLEVEKLFDFSGTGLVQSSINNKGSKAYLAVQIRTSRGLPFFILELRRLMRWQCDMLAVIMTKGQIIMVPNGIPQIRLPTCSLNALPLAGSCSAGGTRSFRSTPPLAR